MKLLFCEYCWDVFKLVRNEVRSCKCGKVRGKYEADGHKAVVNGQGISMAISNPDLVEAISRMKHKRETTPRVEFWIRPHSGNDNPRTVVDPNL